MHVHRRIAASLVAAALITPAAAQASFSPDDRALYRGSSAAPAPASQSPDDRPYYRGGSDNLAPSSVSPDDRTVARNVAPIDPGSPRVVTISLPAGFDWGDAALGSTFGAALALLLAGGAAVMVTQRRRTLRSA
jgi:hypothetical protein